MRTNFSKIYPSIIKKQSFSPWVPNICVFERSYIKINLCQVYFIGYQRIWDTRDYFWLFMVSGNSQRPITNRVSGSVPKSKVINFNTSVELVCSFT